MISMIIWNIISTILFGAQVYYEFALFRLVKTLNILPARFMSIFMGALAGALVISLLLLYVKQSRKLVWRILRTTIAGLIVAMMVLSGIVAQDLMGTLNHSLTEAAAATHPGTVIGVYVLMEDPAQTIGDTADYIFAYGEDFDVANARDTVFLIQDELDATIRVESRDTVLDCIDALYSGECQALIMNKVYGEILASTEGDESGTDYSDFDRRVRLLGEYVIEDTNGTVFLDKEEEEEENTRVIDVTSDTFVVYLSGSDTRDRMLTTSRSDVNILAVVNVPNHEVLLINTPRDYYVSNTASPEGKKDKLTHCGIYGINCSMTTLSQLYGIPVDFYAQINFTGFEKLIDAVGGVDVYSDVAYADFSKGENHLNGQQALIFARERHALAGGDFDRGKNQMKIIQALIDKLTSPALLTGYGSVVKSLDGMFVTDFTPDKMGSVVQAQLVNGGSWDVRSYAVTGDGAMDYTYSMPRTQLYVCVPHQSSVERAARLVQFMLEGGSLKDSDLE